MSRSTTSSVSASFGTSPTRAGSRSNMSSARARSRSGRRWVSITWGRPLNARRTRLPEGVTPIWRRPIHRRSRRPAPPTASTSTGPARWVTSVSSRRPGRSIEFGRFRNTCRATSRQPSSSPGSSGLAGSSSARWADGINRGGRSPWSSAFDTIPSPRISPARCSGFYRRVGWKFRQTPHPARMSIHLLQAGFRDRSEIATPTSPERYPDDGDPPRPAVRLIGSWPDRSSSNPHRTLDRQAGRTWASRCRVCAGARDLCFRA